MRMTGRVMATMGLLAGLAGLVAAWLLTTAAAQQVTPQAAGLPSAASPAKAASPGTTSVLMRWDANTEADLAGYVVSWGDKPGAYDRSRTVGPGTTSVELELAPRPQPYFVAVQARDAAGRLSGYSNEFGLDLSSGLARPLKTPKANASSSTSTKKAGAKPKLTKEQKAQARREKQERKKKAQEAAAQKTP